MLTNTLLEIRVHLDNGCTTAFIQNDMESALKILEAIHPNHIFSAAQLLIGSEHTLTAFQPRLIVRVDVVTDLVPNWSFVSNALNTHEISEDEFKTRNHPNRDVQSLPSQELVVFGEWEMVDGSRYYLQTHMTGFEQKRLPVEMSMFLQKVMTSGGLLARGRTGGYVILNPANLVRLTSYLGLQELPANALQMIRLPD